MHNLFDKIRIIFALFDKIFYFVMEISCKNLKAYRKHFQKYVLVLKYNRLKIYIIAKIGNIILIYLKKYKE